MLEVIDAIAARLGYAHPSSARGRVLAAFAGMVGTLQMARTVTNPQLSEGLLEQGVQNALATLRDPSIEGTSADGAHRGHPIPPVRHPSTHLNGPQRTVRDLT
jgi:hypothetical protein